MGPVVARSGCGAAVGFGARDVHEAVLGRNWQGEAVNSERYVAGRG